MKSGQRRITVYQLNQRQQQQQMYISEVLFLCTICITIIHEALSMPSVARSSRGDHCCHTSHHSDVTVPSSSRVDWVVNYTVRQTYFI